MAAAASLRDQPEVGIAMHTLTMLLSTPLADLRACWLEERCCEEPLRSPL